MANVILDDVTKVYAGGTLAVSGLTLEIDDGEFMVFVGPSGCGKTTALRMVAGLEDISSGTLKIGERVVNDVPPKSRDVAMVFQNYALYPHLTVRENIGFGLKLRKVPKDEIAERVEKAAAILGLTELLDRKPRALSGGQRQRVAMGRAIVREPQAFLMDEPLSNLDAKLRVQMRSEILRIQRDLGVTTVYVTHDQVEAMTMGDRVAVMRKGELQQVAAPQVLYEQPENLFVAGFIGSPAMNMVEARIELDGGAAWLHFGSTRLRLGDEVLAERPALRGYDGRSVVLGLRPEDMEDASLHTDFPPDQRLRASADLVEELGAETLVHFRIDAPRVLTEDTRELAADVGTEDVDRLVEDATAGTSEFVARVSPRSQVKEGAQIELAVDTARAHFFDLDTGLAIRDGHR
ncbi:MAG TPA: sn-glycerol-3-phosphate ABC transporter ATP-binding protein UgpC [Acidimicrobiia bacterium]|nr:sn-glycerol-3-phosphate ABC transporter ATP-binding protein UgpC [Acidimicrobiia bacterium]